MIRRLKQSIRRGVNIQVEIVPLVLIGQWWRNRVGDVLKDGLTLILSSNLAQNLAHNRVEPESTPSSRKNSAQFALMLRYDERMFRYLPQGLTKVVTRPFKVLPLTQWMPFSNPFVDYLRPINHSKSFSTYLPFKTPPDPKNLQPERRASQRFSIERRIRYRAVSHSSIGISGSGRTVNMSSVGMLIATDFGLSVGCRIEVEVDGPFQVDNQVYWKLIVTGSVVRSETRAIPLVCLKISGHEFRTTRVDLFGKRWLAIRF
jgi:hypothetical protein